MQSMKLLEVKSLAIPDIKIIRFARFLDHRGYFTEHFRKSDLKNHPELSFLHDVEFLQCNESYSKKGVLRGLHFQWNPYMGKLVRPTHGTLIDMGLDIRKNSPTFGKIVAYEMPTDHAKDYDEWIWLPPGFAHGVIFPEDSKIEYFCSGEYNPACEACISPLSTDIDWSVCDPTIKATFDEITSSNLLISDKDKAGLSLSDWQNDERSENFIFGET